MATVCRRLPPPDVTLLERPQLRRFARSAYRWSRDVSGAERRAAHGRIAVALSRAAATSALRRIDEADPASWEFCGFSQHGEDGIIDYLCGRMVEPNRFFVEIGAADGLENCTAWLAFARHFAGLWVEGDRPMSRTSKAIVRKWNWAVNAVCAYAEPTRVDELLALCPHDAPDVFSLDIDSMDYYVAQAVLALGYRPKVWVVEYNSAFGPERAVTVPYAAGFERFAAHPTGLYYGCSLAGWRRLFEPSGYTFVTVESSGTNAFFLDPGAFPHGFAERLAGLAFRDNEGDFNGATRPQRDSGGRTFVPVRDWRRQFESIADLPLIDIP